MIGFLHPWALAGLAAAGLPLLLHLIQRREPPTVEFPAVRYLVDATREHQRRLQLRNWLLLLIRTLLIVLVVLAAAGPSAAVRGTGGHAPAALVLILDNSLSSGAVSGGSPMLNELRRAAREVLTRATPEDALWLVLADGIPRRAEAAQLRRLVDSVVPSAYRLDLGGALTRAQQVLDAQRLPGEMVMLTDLQASALSAAETRSPVLVGRPVTPPVRNVGVAAMDPGPQPWSPSGGRATISVVGDSGAPVPATVQLGDRPARQLLVGPGAAVSASLPVPSQGWWILRTELDPDELLGDNLRLGAVRVAPVARVSWAPEDRYLAAAAEVLEGNGRILLGGEVTLGSLGPGASIVQPPEDPAQLGALNRALARRGVGWSYGSLIAVSAVTDSGRLLGRERVDRRYVLVPGASGLTGVVATVGGTPWIVRSGNVLLIGSRLDPAWTGLPLSAAFMPLMDALVNRFARGEVVSSAGAPGDLVPLPDLVTEVRVGGGRLWRVEGGAPFRPTEAGIYFLLSGQDTVGALAVNPDSRESLLNRAVDRDVQALWKTADVTDPADAASRAFGQGLRADLRGPLLWCALALAFMELFIASLWRKKV